MPLAFDWDVLMAVNNTVEFGRLAVMGGPYWAWTLLPGFSGYDGPNVGSTAYRADSDAMTDAILRWLAQKPTGSLDLLIMQAAGTGSFGTDFQAGMTRLGHTYTLTGSASTWAGYEPLDYDVFIGYHSLSPFTYHGLTDAADKWDYILANKGHVLSEDGPASGWNRYGFNSTGYHSSHSPSYQRPFSCAPIGGLTYKSVQFSNLYLYPGTNTIGGTEAIYYCDTHGTEGVLGLWSEGTL